MPAQDTQKAIKASRANLRSSYVRLSTALAAGAALMLSGCATTTFRSLGLGGHAIEGTVHGGQQPVSHSSIQLYTPGTNGYGSASIPLLTVPVYSDSHGNFAISGDYTCPSSSAIVYLVVSGGNPGLSGLVDNHALAMMAILGPCGSLGPSTFVTVNELTTVAAAWALAPFAVDFAHIGSSATNVQGMLNAVNSADTLVSPASGTAPGNAPANAQIPVAELNSLAGILSSCINSKGDTSPSSACGMLFTAATPAGSPAPTDTIEAALDIARNPGHNVGSIFSNLISAAPFQPTLSSAPADWTIGINWTSPSFQVPADMAVDSQGDVWVLSTPSGSNSSVVSMLNTLGTVSSHPQANTVFSSLALDAFDDPWLTSSTGSSVTELTSSGVRASLNPFSGGGINNPGPLAFDGNGFVWVANSGPTVSKLSPSGGSISPGTGYSTNGGGGAVSMALDTSGNVWLTDSANNAIDVLSNSGVPIPGSPYTLGGLNGPFALAIDTTGGAWIANRTGSSLTRLDSAGSPISGSPYYGAGLNQPIALALDGLDNVWVVNSGSNSISEFLSSGRAQSSAAGYGSSSLTNPYRCAIDRSGNVWVANLGSATPGSGVVTQIVGAAAPVTTPQALAVQNTVLDQRP